MAFRVSTSNSFGKINVADTVTAGGGIDIGSKPWKISQETTNLTIKDSDGNPNLAIFDNGAITAYQNNIFASFNVVQTVPASSAFFGLYTPNTSSGLRQQDNGNLDILQNNNKNINMINGTGRVLVGATDDGVSKLQINDTLRLVPRASTPSGPSVGQIYYNSSSNVLQYWNGSTWATVATIV